MSGVRDRMYAILDAQFSAGFKIFNVSTSERIPWRELVEQAEQGGSGLTAPYGILVWGAAEFWDDGPVNVESYMQSVDFYYVTATKSSGTPKVDKDVLTEIEDVLLALTTTVRAETGSGAAFTCFRADAVNHSVELEPNQFFLASNMAFYSGVARFSLQYGK